MTVVMVVVMVVVMAVVVYYILTMNRGLANPSCESRPALVWRYDYSDTPPPGDS